MVLYNIHTHKFESVAHKGLDTKCVLNTYPDEYHEKEELYAQSFFSCGVHPWYADKAEEQMPLLYNIVDQDRLVAIGEVGLDKLKGPDISIQTATFSKQIELAIDLQLPLIIHCVKAWDELIVLRKKYGSKVPWILHGYRGNVQQTIQLSNLGFMFSIGEYFNIESLKHIPLENIFCETDTSDLAIWQIYENISHELGIRIDHFAILAEGNIKKTFRKLTYI